MTYKATIAILIPTAAFLAASTRMNGQSWYADRDMANDLTKSGACVEQERATICFEGGAMDTEAMTTFAELVNRGVTDIETYLGTSRLGSRKIRYFVSSQVEISHSTWRSVYLPLTKVKNRTAPYLHETTHVLAPCDSCPMWFSEGLASYVQSYVSEHTGGYDGGIFTRGGNRGIDRDARRWLASERGKAVISFIGAHGVPPDIDSDRMNVAAPFYVMAQSFVKFLVEHATPEKARAVFDAQDFDAELQSATGKTAGEWKDLWLADLGQ